LVNRGDGNCNSPRFPATGNLSFLRAVAPSASSLKHPELVRESTKEPDVHLYYQAADRVYLCVVTAPAGNDGHFVVTAYFARKHQTRPRIMEQVKVYYDRTGNTLSIWFDDPKKEHVCEESDDDIVLVKDRRGRVIGLERLNFLTEKQQREGSGIPLEVQMV
jgi:uncharacterized protein YuzE